MAKALKIVVTGGPCAGKTSFVNYVVQELNDRGVKVIVVPEAPTMLIAGMNIVPGSAIDLEAFQAFVLELQLSNEAIAQAAAEKEEGPVVILCDRGKLDCLAYVEPGVVDALLKSKGSNLVEARDSYDAVIHLVTAADGAPEAYTLANNAARSETPQEAVEKDRAVMKAWVGHPHLSIIGNEGTFQTKLTKAFNFILESLGIPAPVERERKYLIKYPCIEALEKYRPVCSEIVQTYLPPVGKTERRIRQRGDGEHFTFFYSEKTPLDGFMERFEKEEMISAQQYAVYLAQVRFSETTPIHKQRYCFPYKGQYIELDLYDGTSDYAIVEVEFTDVDQQISLPPELELVREVTGESWYSNFYIAKNGGRFPPEDSYAFL